MNIYKLTDENGGGYDTYDSCIIQAETEEEARNMNPSGCIFDKTKDEWPWDDDWAKPQNVKCELLGTSTNNYGKCVLLASFNAG